MSQNLFGLPFFRDDDPQWLWFLEPANYQGVLAQLGLSEESYLAAWEELLEVFPLSWAEETVPRDANYQGWSDIHPPFLGWLECHPIARFLTQRPLGDWRQAAVVLKLALILVQTRSFSGIQGARLELKDIEQYSGRLFELEALFDLENRGLQPKIVGTPDFCITVDKLPIYLEARHRGAPFWMAVARLIKMPFPSEAKWQHIRVDIYARSGIRNDVARLALSVSNDIKVMLRDTCDSGKKIANAEYTIEHICDGSDRTATFSNGPDRAWRDEVEIVVYRALQEKLRQLKDAMQKGNKAAVLIDCRSLLPPPSLNKGDPQSDRYDELKLRILSAGQTFLEENKSVTGVMWWWRKPKDWSTQSLSSYLEDSWHVSLSTLDNHFETFEPSHLR